MKDYEKAAILATEGIYRAAFPAFRIFIFGQEVSGDVAEVRVNQSGGSQDRSPSTCSFSLVNVSDKYILDHDDMIAISNSRDNLVAYLEQNVDDYKKSSKYLTDSIGQESSVVQEFLRLLSSS